MEEYEISNDQKEKIEIINFNPIKIELNAIKYELSIEAKENMITFTIDDKDTLTNTIKYTRTMSFKEIIDLNNVFYELNSPNEFNGYIRSLSDNKQLILKKDKDKISIILILEVSSTKQIINIDLFPVKKNENLIKKDIWEQLVEIKEKNPEIDLIKQESKDLRKDIFTLKQENIEFKKLISLLIKENKELKKEIIDLKVQKQEKIKESDFSESLDKEISKEDIMKGQQDKKLVTKYVKFFDSKDGKDGCLINNKQIVIQSKKDEVFDNRYRVLSKINRLSNILINGTDTLNRKTYIIKTFKRNIFNTNYAGETKLTIRKPKFINVAFAMMATKGLYSKDKLQFRKNRLSKGGVVDFAWENMNTKTKFHIKKYKAKRKGTNHINYNYREMAAKIVQVWWRERKLKNKKILERIIKIQSVFRGKHSRKYVYETIFLSYLHQKFIKIMSKTLVNHIRPKVFDELFPRNKLLK